MNARATRSKFRMVTQRGGAPVTALLKKEAARYFGSTIYLFNTSFGLVMLAVGAVAACVRRDALLALFEQEMGLAVTPADCYGVVAAAVCLMPVSYTHLDVYKRQVQNREIKNRVAAMI